MIDSRKGRAGDVATESGGRPTRGVDRYLIGAACAVVGAIVAVFCYWMMAVGIELGIMPSLRVAGAPVLSYGAEAGLIITPIFGAMGASVGIALYLRRIRRQLAAIVVLIGSSIGGLTVLGGLWSADYSRYGLDPSAVVLYLPGSLFCLLLFLLAVISLGRR
jgi:hypothetical protein